MLTAEEKRQTMRQLIQKLFVEANATAHLTTDDVLAMVDGLDGFIEANLAAINNAIPLPVRTNATLSEKALALAFVAMKRGGII